MEMAVNELPADVGAVPPALVAETSVGPVDAADALLEVEDPVLVVPLSAVDPRPLQAARAATRPVITNATVTLREGVRVEIGIGTCPFMSMNLRVRPILTGCGWCMTL